MDPFDLDRSLQVFGEIGAVVGLQGRIRGADAHRFPIENIEEEAGGNFRIGGLLFNFSPRGEGDREVDLFFFDPFIEVGDGMVEELFIRDEVVESAAGELEFVLER